MRIKPKSDQDRKKAYRYFDFLMHEQDKPFDITQPRSNPQNALMWKLLGQVSKQVEWYGQKLSSEDWKHVLSASLTGQRSIPGIDGGFVVLGVSTSKQSKEWLSNMIELIYAFGSQNGVKFETNEY